MQSTAALLYRMCTGRQVPDDLSSSLETIGDPLQRELVTRALLATSAPSAAELTQTITELSPFDVRKFANSTRALLDVEMRAKTAALEEAKRRAATCCVMICEPGNGTADCETSLVLLRALRDMGHIEPLGGIANLRPSSERARILLGTLDALGMRDVLVGVGSEGTSTTTARADRSWDSTESSYITPSNSDREETIITGPRLLSMVFKRAAPASITLL